MEKYSIILAITDYVRGTTGLNFQQCLGEILRIYYKSCNKTFEMPDSAGGDDKNDGWVKEDAVFYQIFAPATPRSNKSHTRDIQNKFKEDLSGLLAHINNGKWNGTISSFIFVVNTADRDLPKDSTGFYDETVSTLQTQYGRNFSYHVCKLDDITDLLQGVDDIELLKQLAIKLRVSHLIDPELVTVRKIIDFINDVSGKLHNVVIKEHQTTYTRISTPVKIDKNGLGAIKEHIDSILLKLDVVEDAMKTINQDIVDRNKFTEIKKYFITEYERLAATFSGINLYNALLDSILVFTDKHNTVPAEFVVVYLFDHCDLFEKEI